MIESFLYSMQVDLLTQDSLMFESVTNSGEDLRPWIQGKGAGRRVYMKKWKKFSSVVSTVCGREHWLGA